MVVIFVKTVKGKSYGLDVNLNISTLELKRRLQRSYGYGVKTQRLIFAGKVLSDENNLSHYRVAKECSIQLYVNRTFIEEPKSIVEPPPLELPPEEDVGEKGAGKECLKQQEVLSFGELVLVQIQQAESIKRKKSIFSFGKKKMKPYAVLVVGDNSSRGQGIDRSELFGFVLPEDAGRKTVHILLFNADKYMMDALLGSVDVDISQIEMGKNAEFTKMIGPATVRLRIRRCSIASPAHIRVIQLLMAEQRAWQRHDLEKFNISLSQLIGEEAWHTDDSNPVIEYLVSTVMDETITWTNHSLKRVENILLSQGYLHTPGIPTTNLWFSGLRFSSSDTGITAKMFLIQLRQFATPKHIHIGKARPCSFAMVEFKSIRDAILVLAYFQHKTLGSNACIIGFGPRHRLRQTKERYTNRIEMGGFLNIHGIEHGYRNVWRSYWCFLMDDEFLIYKSSSDLEPFLRINMINAIVCRREKNSLEVYVPYEEKSYFLHSVNSPEILQWEKCLKFTVVGQVCPKADSSYTAECLRCMEKVALDDSYILDASTSFSCLPCLRKDVITHIENKSIQALSMDFSIRDLRDLLDEKEFNNYLDVAFNSLVTTDSKFVSCPKCSSTWEFVPGQDEDAPDFSLIVGLDNRPLDGKAQRHYLSHRIVCRECGINFCRSCREEGYHTGFTCVDHAMYKNARHCRYCSIALMPDTIAQDPPSDALADVCNSEECLNKRENACLHTLPCGHACPGPRGHPICMPCLVPDCPSFIPELTQNKDDFCNICFVESLESQPCIQLDCGHIFHYDCVMKKIEEGKKAPSRIEFGYLNCPLCKIRMSHPMLDFTDVQTLHRDLQKQTYEILEQECLLNCEEITNENSEYYGDPCGYGLYKRFAFYRCYQCKQPYYGGQARCADGLVDPVAEDFICGGCSGIGKDSCAKHGEDFIVYKCRFCCSVSSFKCWGTTHFCKDCHDRQEAHDYMTTKTADQLPQCTPETCKLGIKHAPNGKEFSLGCALCRGNDGLQLPSNSAPPRPADN